MGNFVELSNGLHIIVVGRGISFPYCTCLYSSKLDGPQGSPQSPILLETIIFIVGPTIGPTIHDSIFCTKRFCGENVIFSQFR